MSEVIANPVQMLDFVSGLATAQDNLADAHTTAASIVRAFLNEEQVRQLRLVLDRLRSDRRIRRVEVVGHADQIGAEAHNVRLSERRAASVVEWLVSHGFARRRLVAVGRGSAQPLVQGGSPEQLGTNRRVEFIIVDPPPASN